MSSAVLPLLVGLPLLAALGLVAAPAAGARWHREVGLATAAATLVLALGLLLAARPGATGVTAEVDLPWVPSLGTRFHLGVDGISLPLVVLTALLTTACVVWTCDHPPTAGRSRELVALLLLLEGGMLGTFAALDLLVFFVFFELVLVPMYLLVAVWGGPGRSRAATKFVLYTLLGSALMLLGFLLIGTSAGSFDMVALAARHGAGIGAGTQRLAFLALLLGFAVKAPAWPLHTWLPDAHTEAPTVGSVLLAGVLLKTGTYGLVRIALPEVPVGAHDLAPVLAVAGVVGIGYGSLVCLAQRDLKRLVAYSSVGHMGFVLLGIATLTPTGVAAALYGNIAHGLITGLLFFLVGAAKDRFGSTDTTELGGGLLAKLPLLGGLLVFTAVASLGLPGLAGFWGELLAVVAGWSPAAGLGLGLYRALAVAAAVGTLLTAAYLLVVVRRVALGRVADRWRAAAVPDATAVELAVWAPLVASVVALGLWPRLVLGLVDAPVRGLLGVG